MLKENTYLHVQFTGNKCLMSHASARGQLTKTVKDKAVPVLN
jgi:hypothetical protein